MEPDKTNIPVDSSANSEKPINSLGSILKNSRNIVLAAILLTMIVVCFILYNKGITVGAEMIQQSYAEAYNSNKQLVTEYFYNKAEEKYHVSNDVSISIATTEEAMNLEVLKVSDTEYVISDASENNANCTAWLEVPGSGTFTIDLETAEFIVDNYRKHVVVRVPKPELSNVKIDSEGLKSVFVKGEFFDKNYEVGEGLAQLNINQGSVLLTKEFLSNQYFYESAKHAAESIIINRVKQWNPEIEGLTVEVEFY